MIFDGRLIRDRNNVEDIPEIVVSKDAWARVARRVLTRCRTGKEDKTSEQRIKMVHIGGHLLYRRPPVFAAATGSKIYES